MTHKTPKRPAPAAPVRPSYLETLAQKLKDDGDIVHPGEDAMEAARICDPRPAVCKCGRKVTRGDIYVGICRNPDCIDYIGE